MKDSVEEKILKMNGEKTGENLRAGNITHDRDKSLSGDIVQLFE